MNPRVEPAKAINDHELLLHFLNGEKRIFSLSKYFSYPVYEPLLNSDQFKQVQVFNGVIVWGDDIDFDPDTVYLESIPVDKQA